MGLGQKVLQVDSRIALRIRLKISGGGPVKPQGALRIVSLDMDHRRRDLNKSLIKFYFFLTPKDLERFVGLKKFFFIKEPAEIH